MEAPFLKQRKSSKYYFYIIFNPTGWIPWDLYINLWCNENLTINRIMNKFECLCAHINCGDGYVAGGKSVKYTYLGNGEIILEVTYRWG